MTQTWLETSSFAERHVRFDTAHTTAEQAKQRVIDCNRGSTSEIIMKSTKARFKVGDRVYVGPSPEPKWRKPSHQYSCRAGIMYEGRKGTILKVAPYGIGDGSSTFKNGVEIAHTTPWYMIQLDSPVDLGGPALKDPIQWPCNYTDIVCAKQQTTVQRIDLRVSNRDTPA